MGIEEDLLYANSIDDPMQRQAYIKACINVHCPNGTYFERCIILQQYMESNNNKVASYQEHARAIKSFLLRYEESMANVHEVEIVIAKMRKATQKIIKKRLNDSIKKQVRSDKINRQKYWKNHTQTIIREMEAQLDGLEMQLQRTNTIFADLAAESYTQLQEIMHNTRKPERSKKYAVMQSLDTAWSHFREVLQEAIQAKNALPPILEREIHNMRNILQQTMTNGNPGHAPA